MKICSLVIGFMISVSVEAEHFCGNLTERFDQEYKLSHLAAAEQRIVLINSDNNPYLLELGELLFDDWLLEHVMYDQAVFMCNSNKTVRIIVHKFESSSPRPPDIIKNYEAQPVYKGLGQ